MTLLVFILILSVLVFVHEFGHFLAAKKTGILVEEFGFGLPPRIWGKKVGETLYSINALPIGGFVKLYGEDGEYAINRNQETVNSQNGRAYYEKSIPRRLTVLLAGVIMNLILAIVCFSILYYVSGIPTKTGKLTIIGISENSPAQAADLKPEDQIISLDNQAISGSKEFIKLAGEKAGQKIELEIYREKNNPCRKEEGLPAGPLRSKVSRQVLGGMAPGTAAFNCHGENLIISLIPRESPPVGEGPLGVAITDVEFIHYPWWKMPVLGAKEGIKESISWGAMILEALKKTFSSLILMGQVPKDIAGPVGIFQITGQATSAGFLAVLQFLGILSVNLAIINILPFPALDGGRLIFLGYELIFRKKPNAKVEATVNSLGMAFLLGLMVLITVNDVLRLLHK